MRVDLARVVGRLLALLLLVLIVQQTVGALRDSGVWTRPRGVPPAADPFAGLERVARTVPRGPTAPVARDPFRFGRETAVALRRAAAPRPAQPAEPPRPQLTSIVWVEGNPSATIRWNGQDRTVQVNSLFDEFRVLRITREQVTLERGADTLALRLPRKGD